MKDAAGEDAAAEPKAHEPHPNVSLNVTPAPIDPLTQQEHSDAAATARQAEREAARAVAQQDRLVRKLADAAKAEAKLASDQAKRQAMDVKGKQGERQALRRQLAMQCDHLKQQRDELERQLARLEQQRDKVEEEFDRLQEKLEGLEEPSSAEPEAPEANNAPKNKF